MIVVHGEGNVMVSRSHGQVARSGSLCDRGLVVNNIDDETAIVEGNAIVEQILNHLMGDSLFAQVLQDEFHRRIVGKAAILLVEAEEGGMQMDGERGGTAAKLAQDVFGGSDVRFGYFLDGRVATCAKGVGARAQASAQAGSRAAHGMSGLCCRRRRHAECWHQAPRSARRINGRTLEAVGACQADARAM